jgi:hypothetical protein
MCVPVVQVWEVRVTVRHGRMSVGMDVWLTRRVVCSMLVSMMLVVHVFVVMVLDEVQPQASAHQGGRR